MKNYLVIVLIVSMITSCVEIKNPKVEKSDLANICNELKKENNFKKFIGYHIVRRDNENYFMHRNLMIDSSDFVVPNFRASEGTKDYEEKELFFKNNPDARIQFDIMKKLDIKAVITENYNPETSRLEYSENVGHDFHNYELIFAFTDSISITNINFDTNTYFKIIDKYFQVTEKLDTNWFVLKRK